MTPICKRANDEEEFEEQNEKILISNIETA